MQKPLKKKQSLHFEKKKISLQKREEKCTKIRVVMKIGAQ
jgi:hypothetical protein